MAGFIFRSRRVFTLEELAGLEGVYVEDLDPAASVVGTGSGNVCLIGEFDDGPINVLTEIDGGDITRQFGGLGYTYAGVTANNPCARRHAGEIWNGNGFIYSRFIQAPRFMVVRPDTSVGSVAFSPQAMIRAGKGPFALIAGDQISYTTNLGGPALSTAIAATRATHTGSAPIVATGFLGGEQITIALDGGPTVTVTFAASDQTAAAVVSRINTAFGTTIATQAAGTVTVVGIQYGSGGRLILANVSAGALAAMFLTAATYSGTGNVANLALVTATEVATIINGTAALNAIGGKATVLEDGALGLYATTAGSGTLLIAAGAMATTLGVTTIGTTVKAGEHSGGTIAAGTRVRTGGGLEWVTMLTLTVAAGTNAAPNVGPHSVKVRPATDDGSAVGTGANTATVLVDQPSFATMTVTNPSAITAALTEPQIDAAYKAALDQTLDPSSVAVDINYVYSARGSISIDTYAADNAENASNNGLAGRKYIRSGAIGLTKAQAKVDRALLASDRVFYTWPGWQVVIPEIERRGASGGVGFSDTGIVTLRACGTLAKVDALLAPEENPGQQTLYLTNFFAVEAVAIPLTAADYRDLKASGICAPRRDREAGSIFQSGITSSLTAGRTTQARRKMADFIQDSLARLLLPYSKKLQTDSRRDAVVGVVDGFLAGLLSESDRERQRIAAYSIDLTLNTATTEALGIYVLDVKVRTLASFDAIEIRTEIGEGVVTTSELAEAA